MGRVVLVTGVAGQVGSETARRLAADPAVDKVVGVDVLPPRGDLAGVRFVRADIRNPVIAKVLAVEDVDTVAHLGVQASGSGAGGRTSMKESNVIGTMQLLAACQRSPGLRRLVLKSSTAVYGSSPRDPAIFSEDTPATHQPTSGYAKDCAEVEGYLRGFGRRRPDIAITTLRCADVLSARLDTPLGQYLKLPVIPRVLGFDPRLQLLHVEDALDIIHRGVVQDRPGTYNVAGRGVVLLSQVVRRLGKLWVSMPSLGFRPAGGVLRRTGRLDLAPDLVRFLTHGRVVDTAAVRTGFGWAPRWSTARTLADFATEVGHGPVAADRVRQAEQLLLTGITGGR
ncbi:NAD-dependent epimerase/dehydratase family protein [soil metagenome]